MYLPYSLGIRCSVPPYCRDQESTISVLIPEFSSVSLADFFYMVETGLSLEEKSVEGTAYTEMRKGGGIKFHKLFALSGLRLTGS